MLILGDKGNISGGRAGEVKITFTIEPHSLFQRNGIDITMKRTISLKESLCGFTLEFQHLNGNMVSLNNKLSSESTEYKIILPGTKKVLPGLGIQRNGQSPGNLIIEFQVEFPTVLTDSQIEELARIL